MQIQKVILFVASGWNNEKGLQTILNLAAKLNDNEKIVLVGNLCGSVELPQNIVHMKATNSVSELVKYYSMADVFVQTSLE